MHSILLNPLGLSIADGPDRLYHPLSNTHFRLRRQPRRHGPARRGKHARKGADQGRRPRLLPARWRATAGLAARPAAAASPGRRPERGPRPYGRGALTDTPVSTDDHSPRPLLPPTEK